MRRQHPPERFSTRAPHSAIHGNRAHLLVVFSATSQARRAGLQPSEDGATEAQSERAEKNLLNPADPPEGDARIPRPRAAGRAPRTSEDDSHAPQDSEDADDVKLYANSLLTDDLEGQADEV